jgi:hypothetical protein
MRMRTMAVIAFELSKVEDLPPVLVHPLRIRCRHKRERRVELAAITTLLMLD